MSARSVSQVPSALLPGQAAAAEGPVDLLVTYALNHGLRRDARRFVEASRRTPVDDAAAWGRLGRRWEDFAGILRMVSQGQDRGLWPALRERGDVGEQVVLEAMATEHAALEPQLTVCAHLFSRLARDGDGDVRSALLVRLVATRDALLRHLEHEEHDAMPLLQHHLTEEEWQRIDREFYRAQLSVRSLATLVPWAAYDLPRPVLRAVLSRAGFGFRVLWWVTRSGFARREARSLGR